MLRVQTLAGSVLAWSLFAATGYAQDSQPAKPPPPAVGYVEVVQQDVTPTRNFIGRVEAVERVELRARVTGFLDKQLFEEGRPVKKNDLLFVIEQPPFAAQTQIAEANLEDATVFPQRIHGDGQAAILPAA